MLQHKTPAQLSHVHKNGTKHICVANVSMVIQYNITKNSFWMIKKVNNGVSRLIEYLCNVNIKMFLYQLYTNMLRY